MRWLVRRNMRGVSMRELLDATVAGRARGLVGLTFDDGYLDFATEALPILIDHRFTATVFALGGKLGGYSDWDERRPTRPLMSAGQLRQVSHEGIEIGSHGLDHRSLPYLSPAEVVDEIWSSRAMLADAIGAQIQGFCYPYGCLRGGADRTVRAAGYSYACARRAEARRDRFALPRTAVSGFDAGFMLRVKRIRHRLEWG